MHQNMHTLRVRLNCIISVVFTDAVVGVNVPPLHPNCRSFLVGVYDDLTDILK